MREGFDCDYVFDWTILEYLGLCQAELTYLDFGLTKGNRSDDQTEAGCESPTAVIKDYATFEQTVFGLSPLAPSSQRCRSLTITLRYSDILQLNGSRRKGKRRVCI